MTYSATVWLLFLALVCTLGDSAVVINQLQGFPSTNLVFSGSIAISATNSLFFTYYGADGVSDPSLLKNSPLIVCVGSPGTSSQYLSLNGVGPLLLNSDLTISPNPNTFTSFASVMFIDLLGSGFSFAASPADIPTQHSVFGTQLSTAFNAFAKESQLGQSSVVVIAGEGTFIRALVGLDDIDALKGVIHLAPWSELYAMGRYYGVAGVEMKIIADSDRITVQSTFSSCYTNLRNSKFLQAHQCFDSTLNYIQSKSKNCNLFNTKLGYNFTQFLALGQYYMSQPQVVSKFKAPTTRLFQSQSSYISNKTYVDFAKNYTKELSQFTKDYLNVKHWFVCGDSDFLGYYNALKLWTENELAFVESDAYKAKKLEDVLVDDTVVGVGKAVKQITYTVLKNAGHYIIHDQAKAMSALTKKWITSLQHHTISVQE